MADKKKLLWDILQSGDRASVTRMLDDDPSLTNADLLVRATVCISRTCPCPAPHHLAHTPIPLQSGVTVLLGASYSGHADIVGDLVQRPETNINIKRHPVRNAYPNANPESKPEPKPKPNPTLNLTLTLSP